MFGLSRNEKCARAFRKIMAERRRGSVLTAIIELKKKDYDEAEIRYALERFEAEEEKLEVEIKGYLEPGVVARTIRRL